MFKQARVYCVTLFLLFVFYGLAFAGEVLTWQDCIKEAAKNHPDLIAAVEEIKQSEASKKITASALYPQVDASLTASTGRTASDNAPATTADAYNYGVSATQLIFDGTKTIQSVKAASETIQAFQQNYKFTSTTVRLSLRTAFVNLLTAQEMIKVTEDIVKIRKENYELITLRYLSGLVHRGALLTAEANLAQALFQLEQAKRDVLLAQRQLTKEMGRKAFIPMNVIADFKVSDDARIQPDLEAIANKHPSLLQIAAQKNAAEFSLKSAYANFSPTLSGSAGANKNGTKWLPKGDQWNLGLTLSMPIFEGGLRTAQVSQAQAFLNQLKENERSTRDSLVVALENTWVSLQDAIETVDVQYKNLIATEERSKIGGVEFATGFLTYDNWTIIEDNLVSAKTGYLDAQSSALLAEANWIKAKGETLEYAKK
jgi:outer membrane protein TolC